VKAQYVAASQLLLYAAAIDIDIDIRATDRYAESEADTVEMVKVSPKFQVVIPKRVREQLQLKPGVELHVYVLDGVIRLSPPRSIKQLRGIAKGLRWKDEDRDHSERF
jgi:AbrB family looped-hinge helix DNA binding protein